MTDKQDFTFLHGNSELHIAIMAKSIKLLSADLFAFGDLKQIAKEAGFSSPQHFSRTFAARYGIPPQQFRALARERAKRRDAVQRRKGAKATATSHT